MKFKDYRKTTYKICIRFCKEQTWKNYHQLWQILNKWEQDKRDGNLKDYGYIGNVLDHLEYCSDRMNSGRAKALKRLLEEFDLESFS